GPPQVRSLAAQFNQMAGRLAELVDAEARFVADASHQLRSPLTALRLRLENLEAGSGGAAGDGLAAAGREVQRLSRVVDGLLTLSRTGGAEPDQAPVDVQAVIDERCDAWSALAEERGVELAVVGERRPIETWLVPGDLDQILDNLLANALDASSQGGRIRVEIADMDTGHFVVHVVDEGPGMTAEERERAFDRFWQAAPSDLNGGHSGLGLAIVAQIADRNRASVELRQGQPTGIDAVIRLPVSTRATRTRQAQREGL
ncbi:MAG: sensor histidine kinase, partial [Acidimicrobiales bacterium]